MYKSILIPTDGSELAMKAVEHGLALGKAVNAPVTFVTATADWSATQMSELVERGVAEPVQHYEKKAAAWAGKVLAECEDRARRAGVNCTTIHAQDKAAADAIIETAKAKGCDLIVMSSHGRGGVGRMLLGSVANKVLTYSTLPVLICR
jgi:nucleotide-binding universal stress UspA family protein